MRRPRENVNESLLFGKYSVTADVEACGAHAIQHSFLSDSTSLASNMSATPAKPTFPAPVSAKLVQLRNRGDKWKRGLDDVNDLDKTVADLVKAVAETLENVH